MKTSFSLLAAVAAVGSVCTSAKHVASSAKHVSSSDEPCPKLSTVTDFNVTEYTRKTWFFQKQQLTEYLPQNTFYCVAATYNLEGKKVPLFNGTVVSVYNYANEDKVNGANHNKDGMVLCARQPNASTPAALEVAPCFLPNALAGDYDVIAVGGSPSQYTWAVIIAGQPTEKFDDGCTTKETGVNGAGLWLATRDRVASNDTVLEMETALKSLGVATSRLFPVEQEGCKYDGAKLK